MNIDFTRPIELVYHNYVIRTYYGAHGLLYAREDMRDRPGSYIRYWAAKS